MKQKKIWGAQLFVVLLSVLGLKLFYSSADPDQLRWILAPTTWLVAQLSGRTFAFEAHAGYMSSDHTFLIAASCAGVNFLITSFLMLSLRTLVNTPGRPSSWRFLPVAAITAYVSTIIANTVRIWVALELKSHSPVLGGLGGKDLHRLEGIVVYFAFLVLLFMLTDKPRSKRLPDLLRQLRLPLFVYYIVTLMIPLANGASRRGFEFWEHSTFVLVVPLVVSTMIVALRSAATWSELGSQGKQRLRRVRHSAAEVLSKSD